MFSLDFGFCKALFANHLRVSCVWIIIIKQRSKLEEERRENVLFMKTIGL